MSQATVATILLYLLSLCPATLTIAEVGGECPGGDNPGGDGPWTKYSGACYKLFNALVAWFPAETDCRSRGGHLASIRSDQENRLIGRITGCQQVWIGRFAIDFRRGRDPNRYDWTDQGHEESATAEEHPIGYSRHNFSEFTDPHMGAIKAAGLSWYNAHYHDLLPYVCKVPAAARQSEEKCPHPFVSFRGICYWLSNFAASFVEANLHCEREYASPLASLHTQEEKDFVNIMDLSSDTCHIETLWIGLIKQYPCLPMKSAAETGEQAVCHQWTDLSGEHSGFPRWAPDHPLRAEWNMNCVSLNEDGLRSEFCYARHRFLCQKFRPGTRSPIRSRKPSEEVRTSATPQRPDEEHSFDNLDR